ncbi:MAG: hypothetical protein JXA25_11670 [Anaerolineales bacterium]|nr:hypothetical protein [Anaerolineales bacterium]
MNGIQKIQALFNHQKTPIPWLEIAVDEAVILRTIGKPLPPQYLESIKPIDVSWADKVDFAQKIGLDALGLYHWEAFGSTEDDSQPVLTRVPHILEWEDLPKLDIPRYSFDELHAPVQEAYAVTREAGLGLFVEFAVCLEYAVSDLGFENLCMKLYTDSNLVMEVLERYTEYTLHLIEHYNRMPEIDFIWIGDDLAYKNGPFISPQMYEEYVFPHIRRATAAITKPWVFHSDGNILSLIDEIVSWGPKAIHPIEPAAMDIFNVGQRYGETIGLIGNLDVDLLTRASREDVVSQTQKLLEFFGERGGYAFSSGNALARFINQENLVAVSETIRKYNERFVVAA